MLPRQTRRLKALGLLALLALLVTLYVTSGARATRSSRFYTSTASALQGAAAAAARHPQQQAPQAHADADVGKRLKDAEERAKAAADAKGGAAMEKLLGAGRKEGGSGEVVRDAAGAVKGAAKAAKEEVLGAVDAGKSVAGRKMMTAAAAAAGGDRDDGVAKVGNVGGGGGAAVTDAGKGGGEKPETREEHEVEAELSAILKRSPIVIFSKSYCPFSRKAKTILLEQYRITPAPHVVELDEHARGGALQDALQRRTGRRTVPNVLVNEKSIGGGDDVEALHRAGKLAATIASLGGKGIVEVTALEGRRRRRRR